MTQAQQNQQQVQQVQQPQQIPAQPHPQPGQAIYVMPTHAVPVNVMPPTPTQAAAVGDIDGYAVAKLGALMAANGATQAAASDYMAVIQSIAIKTALEASHKLLAQQHELMVLQLNQLLQQVRNLPAQNMPISPPQGFMSRAMNGVQPILVREYVDKESVLQQISAMILNPPRIQP